MPASMQCPSCAHYKPGLICKAFPTGIPDEILSGEFDHREEYPGDQGIRWEQKPDGPVDPTTEDEDEDTEDETVTEE